MGSSDETKQSSLLERVSGSDQGAFEELYQAYATPVYRYAYARLGRKEAAEDIVQLVFVKVWEARRNYEHRDRPSLAYLFTIARNTIIDKIRRKEAEPLFDAEVIIANLHDENNSPTRLAEQREALIRVTKAMSLLDEEQLEIVTLRYIADLEYPDIAKILNKKEDNIRQIISRALKQMRTHT